MVSGFGFRVAGFGVRVAGSVFSVLWSGFRVEGFPGTKPRTCEAEWLCGLACLSSFGVGVGVVGLKVSGSGLTCEFARWGIGTYEMVEWFGPLAQTSLSRLGVESEERAQRSRFEVSGKYVRGGSYRR